MRLKCPTSAAFHTIADLELIISKSISKNYIYSLIRNL